MQIRYNVSKIYTVSKNLQNGCHLQTGQKRLKLNFAELKDGKGREGRGERGREGTGITEAEGGDGGQLCGKGVEKGGKEREKGEGRDGNKGKGGRGWATSRKWGRKGRGGGKAKKEWGCFAS